MNPKRNQRTVSLGLGLQVAFYRGRGCQVCRDTGYRGRVGLFEYLVMSDPQRELVMARASAAEMKRTALQAGMQELRVDGIRKAARGITSIEEVLRATQADGD